MLKPSVGLIVEMSSPLNFLRIVVLPALSRPLRGVGGRRRAHEVWVWRARDGVAAHGRASRDAQNEQPDLLLFLLDLAQDRQKTHLTTNDERVVGPTERRGDARAPASGAAMLLPKWAHCSNLRV